VIARSAAGSAARVLKQTSDTLLVSDATTGGRSAHRGIRRARVARGSRCSPERARREAAKASESVTARRAPLLPHERGRDTPLDRAALTGRAAEGWVLCVVFRDHYKIAKDNAERAAEVRFFFMVTRPVMPRQSLRRRGRPDRCPHASALTIFHDRAAQHQARLAWRVFIVGRLRLSIERWSYATTYLAPIRRQSRTGSGRGHLG
jgi:hypothetical protein